MKGKINLVFDWKSMGFNAYVPFLAAFFILGYSFLAKNDASRIIPALEFSFPIFAAWWSVFLFYDLLEEPGSETIFTYPVSRWSLGITRVLSYFALYLFLLFFLLWIVDAFAAPGIFAPMYVQLAIQSFFYCTLGFVSMAATLNAGWSLVIVVIYSSTQILTRGELFPWINIYLFNQDILDVGDMIPMLSLAVFFGILNLGVGQYLIHTLKRFH
ncbi:hypothetical protein [Lihuaxuella thermophila]|uniref:ABC-2 type transport system permease protein n=1 Tax=Lihuaxuella thermophila TaxID=1173111 RepID=A0A1H8G793_9BACL|nr:hypothetical protein [Lihuaxuella thermophila]SEN39863.1 hypothetical protein SAMN05444955_110124 [Lihuaxuella thermophila]